MWARIDNNEVVEITEIDPAGRFHSSLVFVDCDETVLIGDVYQGGGFSSPPFDFNVAFNDKVAEVVSRFKAAMSVITDTYTAEDIASFPTQETEAAAWQADNAAATPFIDGLLANRPGIDKATLVQRILDNAATYKNVAGPVIGKKQAYEDQLYALKSRDEDPEQPDVTQAELDAIVGDFS